MVETRHKKDIIYQQLKENILTGAYPAAMKFPKELDFAKELGVGKITLRSALSRLETEGLVARIPSKGTFVLDQDKPKHDAKQILVITTDLDTFESPNGYILPGIENAIVCCGYETVPCDRSFIEALSIDEFTHTVKTKNIIGIILLAEHFNGSEPLIGKLQATNLPVVLPHANANDTKATGFASIYSPRPQGWNDAVKHLHDQGHERVATIAIRPDNIRGYSELEHRNLLKSYGMAADNELIGYAPYDKNKISDVVNQWLEMPLPPTAILCFSDFFAIEVYETLKKQHVKIPDDIAVMGYCGFPGGSFMSPPLSTIDFEYNKLGKMSVELLLKADEWYSTSKKIAVPRLTKPHQLIIRESTAIKRLEKQYQEELIHA